MASEPAIDWPAIRRWSQCANLILVLAAGACATDGAAPAHGGDDTTGVRAGVPDPLLATAQAGAPARDAAVVRAQSAAPPPGTAPAQAQPTDVRESGRADGAATFFEYQVEQPVEIRHTVRAVYPPALKARGLQGAVLVQFVVDTSGVVDPASVKVLDSSHDEMAAAVTRVLPHWRFQPARRAGRPVRQVVQLPFNFR